MGGVCSLCCEPGHDPNEQFREPLLADRTKRPMTTRFASIQEDGPCMSLLALFNRLLRLLLMSLLFYLA